MILNSVFIKKNYIFKKITKIKIGNNIFDYFNNKNKYKITKIYPKF